MHHVARLDRNGEALLYVYDLVTKTSAVCRPGSGFSNAQSPEMAWTFGANLLLTWGAGSDVAFVHLLDQRCNELLGLGVTGYDMSPDGRYLATFPPRGALIATDHTVRFFDLRSGKRVKTSIDGRELRGVESVAWQPLAATLTVEAASERLTTSEEVRLPE
jgi:hypothetical protein